MKPSVNYEAEYCGRVPLHQTNLIQPHGVLLIVQQEGRKILQASENADRMFGMPVADLVSHSLDDLLSPEVAASFARRFSRPQDKLPFTFPFSSGTYLGLVQLVERHYIIEIELQPRQGVSDETFVSIYQELRFAMAAVEQASTTIEACELAIAELKKLSGFDKIMIYQFDEDWCGDVIAEVKEADMDAYLGLKFPSSDIPKQARELYKRSPYRLIPTITYEPVRIYPVLNPVTNAFTDLSNANLRSVATVHLEYLSNMKVMASMSTRILVNGELWGLIACHHRTPKYLSFELCAVFELLSQVISTRIAYLQQSDAFARRQELNSQYVQLAQSLLLSRNVPVGLNENVPQLLRLLSADGAALVWKGRIYTFGPTPAEKAVDDLVYWLKGKPAGEPVVETSLSAVFEPAEAYAREASGLIALPLGAGGDNYLLAFRGEAVQKVTWAGDPAEAVQLEADRKNYHPRNSFRLWQQTVGQTSLPWTSDEQDQARQLQHFLWQFIGDK